MVNWMIVALIAAMLFVMLLIVSIKVFGHEYDWIAALGAAFLWRDDLSYSACCYFL